MNMHGNRISGERRRPTSRAGSAGQVVAALALTFALPHPALAKSRAPKPDAAPAASRPAATSWEELGDNYDRSLFADDAEFVAIEKLEAAGQDVEAMKKWAQWEKKFPASPLLPAARLAESWNDLRRSETASRAARPHRSPPGRRATPSRSRSPIPSRPRRRRSTRCSRS